MEKWAAIPGWVGFYEVSSLGRVRSLDRKYRHRCGWGGFKTCTYRGRILIATPTPKGYPTVHFTAPGRDRQTKYVHALVLSVFKGKRPAGFSETRHLNGRPADCRLANLRYGTPKQNAADRIRHGTTLRGKKRVGDKWI